MRALGDIILKLKQAGLSILLIERNVHLALRPAHPDQGQVVHKFTRKERANDLKLLPAYICVGVCGSS